MIFGGGGSSGRPLHFHKDQRQPPAVSPTQARGASTGSVMGTVEGLSHRTVRGAHRPGGRHRCGLADKCPLTRRRVSQGRTGRQSAVGASRGLCGLAAGAGRRGRGASRGTPRVSRAQLEPGPRGELTGAAGRRVVTAVGCLPRNVNRDPALVPAPPASNVAPARSPDNGVSDHPCVCVGGGSSEDTERPTFGVSCFAPATRASRFSVF